MSTISAGPNDLVSIDFSILVLQVCCPYDVPVTQTPNYPPQPSGDPGVALRASDLPAPGICGSSIEDRIVGGNETRITEFPWMVLIQYTKRKLGVMNKRRISIITIIII